MFHRSLLGRGLIESDEGFSVKTVSMTLVEYHEGSHVLSVFCEPLVTGVQLSRDSALHWDAPFENDSLSATKREEILANICRAFAFIGEPCEVV